MPYAKRGRFLMAAVEPAHRLPAASPNMKAETVAPIAKELTPKTNCRRRNQATS
jgi:hypothetical protein